MLLSIVIVNYNVKHFLEQCLYSVQKAVAGIEAEVIVVDNNSSDNSIGFLQPKFPLFSFLTKKDWDKVKNYPFATIDPNIGVMPLNDPRLEKLSKH